MSLYEKIFGKYRYTKGQRSRMAIKLAAMKNGQRFILNKNDPENSLEVKLVRRKNSCQIVTLDSGLTLAEGANETALVSRIIHALNNWDDVLDAHSMAATAK